jgi:hypothetical protein
MKAPGLNKITYEHIIFGGELATQVVVKLFNEIVIQGSVTQGKSISRSVFVLQDLLKLRKLITLFREVGSRWYERLDRRSPTAE